MVGKPYKIFDIEVKRFLTSPGGSLSKSMKKRGRAMEALAQQKVRSKTGRLKSSIKYDHRILPTAHIVTLTANAPYAKDVHEGTKPRLIEPNDPKGMLRFVNKGVIVFAHKVLHPGSKPNPFLSKALREVNLDMLT
jgi:hypothetical protein